MGAIKSFAKSLVAFALAAGMLTACVSQGASSNAAIDDFKTALAGAPAYESVTITATTIADGDTDNPTVRVAKFDLSGEKVQSNATLTLDTSISKEYYDGDVVVVDYGKDKVYKVTPDEFADAYVDDVLSVDAFVTSALGGFDPLATIASGVEITSEDENTRYTLTLDPDKINATDKLLADAGEEATAATASYLFDAEGRLICIEEHLEISDSVIERLIEFSDFDSTVVDPAPETDKLFADYFG